MQAITRSGVLSPVPAALSLADFAAAQSVPLTRFAYLICGDRGLAEDLVQDAFMSLYRRFGDAMPLAAPVSYARRAIVNANTSRGRRRSGREAVVSDVPETAVDAVDLGEQDAMWRLLVDLPHRQRAVLVMRYYLDLSDRDIAESLGAREGTVRSLAARAFATLRKHPDLHQEATP